MSLDTDLTLDEMYRFLVSREGDYPFGVPLSALQECDERENRDTQGESVQSVSSAEPRVSDAEFRFQDGQTVQARIAILGAEPFAPGSGESAFSSGVRELLESAITRGLKLEVGEVYLANVLAVFLPSGKRASSETEAARERLFAELSEVQAEVVLVCGQQALNWIAPESEYRRGWQELGGECPGRVLASVSLSDVVRDRNAKRAFWEDLQSVMRELGMIA